MIFKNSSDLFFSDYITDEEDSSDDEDLTRKEIDDPSRNPLQASACVPDYILLSGGNSDFTSTFLVQNKKEFVVY